MVLHVRELDDLVPAFAQLTPAETQDGAVQADVLLPGQLGMKPGAKLDHGRDAPGRDDRPGRWLINAGYQPEYRAFARPVPPHQGDGLTGMDAQIHLAQGERGPTEMHRPPQHAPDEPLPERTGAVLIEVEPLRDASKVDRRQTRRVRRLRGRRLRGG